MRKIYTAATAPPKPPKEPKTKPPKALKPNAHSPHGEFTWEVAEAQGRGQDWCDQVLGEDAMTLVRKLRTLQRRKDELNEDSIAKKTKKYLVWVGGGLCIVCVYALCMWLCVYAVCTWLCVYALYVCFVRVWLCLYSKDPSVHVYTLVVVMHL